MSQISEFWQGVHESRDEVRAALTNQSLQPRDGTCYIMSLRSKMQNTLPGRISLAHIPMAGQRVAEGSHRLATDAEINEYLAEQVHVRQRLKVAELALKQTVVMDVKP